MLFFLNIYYLFITILGIVGTLIYYIKLGEYDIHFEVTNAKIFFFREVFIYQYTAWENLKDYINIVGIILVEIVVTFSAWFLNIIIFCRLLLLLGFYHVFKKREKSKKHDYKDLKIAEECKGCPHISICYGYLELAGMVTRDGEKVVPICSNIKANPIGERKRLTAKVKSFQANLKNTQNN